MPLHTAAAFWAVSFLFVLTPGADWAYAINAGLRHRTVFPAVGGLLAGHLLATIAVAAGVGAVLTDSPAVIPVVTVVGAAYLLWLGVGMATRNPGPRATDDRVSDSWLRRLGTGFAVSGLNPKVFLLFMALLPQFVSAEGTWPAPAQILALGLIHVTSCAVIYIAVGLGADRVLRTRPSAATVVTRGSGVILVILAACLLAEQVVHRF
jgi:threonine/homoserine/homoserine lactone efflux protein